MLPVYHRILLNRLKVSFGFRGNVLNWFTSYLKGRTQCVKVNDAVSDSLELTFGVPQGSVLGPILFTLYTSPLPDIIQPFNFEYHFYADDTQLYKMVTCDDIPNAVAKTENCISKVKEWMSNNKLKLNESKTEFLILGKSSNLDKFDKPSLKFSDCEVKPNNKAKNLGVMFDEELSLVGHIDTLCRAMYNEIKKHQLTETVHD